MVKTFPVNLLLKKKKCLVVGGGSVAQRKILKLAEVDAKIVVVAPDVSARLRELAAAGSILLYERQFLEHDIEDVFLVYAATNDAALNRRIAAVAEAKGILVCAVDGGWENGSFITPASFGSDGITVAVSSHGVACRKTRLIKENLSRHVTAVENADLMVLGIDHRTLPLAKREKLHLAGQDLDRAGAMLMQLQEICGFVLLNTCNRLEIIAVAACKETLYNLVKLIMRFDSLNRKQYYLKTGFEAFHHVCDCLAGYYSQHFGETHIVAQVKQACAYARDRGWAGPVFELVQNHALHVAKRIRNQTSGFFTKNDVEYDVLRFLTAEFTDLQRRNIFIVGAGAVGSQLQEMFCARNRNVTWFYHVNRPVETSASCRLFSLEALPEMLSEADILICALAVEEPVITAAYVKSFRPGATIIDLGIPRNVSPKLTRLRPKLSVVNLEYLKSQQHADADKQKRIIAEATKIIEHHQELYEQFIKSFVSGRPLQ